MQELREAAQEELPQRRQYDLEDLEAAIPKFSPTTARGADQWQPPELRALRAEAKQSLVNIINLCEKKLSWPCQFYRVWYHLLVKAGPNAAGVERPIGSLPFPVRLWGKMAKHRNAILVC
eukprot:191293-Pyramimonas_sp.AAC.1